MKVDSSSRRRYARVVLTGFMGAGKSTTGRLLAPLLGWRFLDIDALLMASTGHSISQLFALHREEGFRALEAAAIGHAFRQDQAVIALGGGALETPATRTLVADDHASLLVYLEAPLHVSLTRCSGDPEAAVRPLLKDRASLEQRFLARLPAYRAAGRVIPTDQYSAQEIAALLASEITTSSGRSYG